MATIFYHLYDEVDHLNIHSEINGPINDKFTFNAAANYNHYTTCRISSMPGTNHHGMQN